MRTHVYVVVSHDNRFLGVFGHQSEARNEAKQYLNSYVVREPVELDSFETEPPA